LVAGVATDPTQAITIRISITMAASTMRRWFLLIVLTAPEVIADSGDDFVNNLVTDLAPYVSQLSPH
jgi:hypothetical protein